MNEGLVMLHSLKSWKWVNEYKRHFERVRIAKENFFVILHFVSNFPWTNILEKARYDQKCNGAVPVYSPEHFLHFICWRWSTKITELRPSNIYISSMMAIIMANFILIMYRISSTDIRDIDKWCTVAESLQHGCAGWIGSKLSLPWWPQHVRNHIHFFWKTLYISFLLILHFVGFFGERADIIARECFSTFSFACLWRRQWRSSWDGKRNEKSEGRREGKAETS